jgi:hypothetical protein
MGQCQTNSESFEDEVALKPTHTTEAPDFGAMEPFELTLWREGMETYRLTTDT